jgi:hypothetical protein
MKYRIPEVIIIEQNDTETIKDIIYHELTEQEFLVEYLRNPRLTYWVAEEDGTKHHYKNGRLVVTIKNGVVVNHSFLEKNAK